MKAGGWYILAVVFLMFGSFILGKQKGKVVNSQHYIIQSDTIYRVDTITLPAPPPKIVERVRTETIYVDSVRLLSKSNIEIDKDSVGTIESINIPIEEKTYETADYKLVISGYNPALERIDIFRRTQQINTIEKYRDNKRFGLGVHVGYGYGGDKVSPYIGIGVHYSVFRF